MQESGRAASTVLDFEDCSIAIYRVISSYIQQNSYVVVDRDTNSAVVIDCGIGAAAAIVDVLEIERAQLSMILLTHEHYDHIRNLNELRERFPFAPLVASDDASASIPDIKRNLSAFHEWGGYSTGPAEKLLIDARETIAWGAHQFIALRTPGHTPGGVCFILGEHVFTGDTLIKGESTIANLPGGDRARLEASLDALFNLCGPETTFRPGHGEPVRAADTSPEVHLRKRNARRE